MLGRTVARVVAPLALVACVVAAVIAVNGAGGSHKTRAVHHVHRVHVPRIYHVRPGQGLSDIASHYGIPLNQILTINPQADPRALQPGERLQLVP